MIVSVLIFGAGFLGAATFEPDAVCVQAAFDRVAGAHGLVLKPVRISGKDNMGISSARPGSVGFQVSAPAKDSLAPENIPGRTPLEKHAAFFDYNGDGLIEVQETGYGLTRLGIGWARAFVLARLINGPLSLATADRWIDKALFRIVIRNIPRGRHPSDTGVFDAQGNFVPEAFERIFDQFSRSKPGFLNEAEVFEMIRANRHLRPGWSGNLAARAEFGLLLQIAADGSDTVLGQTYPSISKERLRQFYDGTLFYFLARKNQNFPKSVISESAA